MTLRVLILSIFIVTGCTHIFPTLSTEDVSAIELRLLSIGNITHMWPPAVIVERNDGTGFGISDEVSNAGSKYVPGAAVLLIENRSEDACFLNDLNDDAWKIVVTFQDGSRYDYPLLGVNRRLPSFPVTKQKIQSEASVAVIIGTADLFPFNPATMISKSKMASMHVVYSTQELQIKSTSLPVEGRRGKRAGARQQGIKSSHFTNQTMTVPSD